MNLEIISIEDSDDDVFILQRALKKAAIAHVFVHFKFGLQAIAHLGRRNNAESRLPSIILLDMNLPDVTGPEMLKWLKKNPKTAPVPAIIIPAPFLSRTRKTRWNSARLLLS